MAFLAFCMGGPEQPPATLSTLDVSGQSEVEFVHFISADDLCKLDAYKKKRKEEEA